MNRGKILFVLFGLVAGMLSAQEKFDDLVTIGDTLFIGEPSSNSYEYIDVPRKNFIIKKGGIANISSIENNTVTITDIEKSKSGETIVTFKKADGNKFFKAYRKLSANLNGAINSGELNFPNNAENDLAK